MITTRREVNIDNGATAYNSRTVQRIAPEEKIVSIAPEAEVKTFNDSQVVSAPLDTASQQNVRIMPRMDFDDLMPVIKNEEVQERKEETRKLSSKAKVMLVVYLATALILALIVLATGLAITGASGEVAALENEVRTQSAVLAESEAVLAHLSDDVTITGAAVNQGMVKTDAQKEIELIELTDKTNYEARSNAFDRFCDFVSGIFGG